ncbi:hypothetical protein ACQ4WX_19125 [Streptomyces lasalocidi]
MAVVELGLLAYSAGTALAARGAARRAARPGTPERLLARRLAPWRVLVLCGLALALAVLLIPGQPGGVMAYFTSRQAVHETGALNDASDSFLQPMRSWSLSVPAFWGLLGLLRLPRLPDGDRLLRGLRWLLLPLLVAVNIVVNNPISKPRFWAGTVLLTLLFNADRLCRPRASRAVVRRRTRHGARRLPLQRLLPLRRPADGRRRVDGRAVHRQGRLRRLPAGADRPRLRAGKGVSPGPHSARSSSWCRARCGRTNPTTPVSRWRGTRVTTSSTCRRPCGSKAICGPARPPWPSCSACWARRGAVWTTPGNACGTGPAPWRLCWSPPSPSTS